MKSGVGFYLSWLRLTGPNLKPAQIDFQPGLNVIWGASETGKSFIFSCIDFMFGRDKPPKQISELKGYTTAWLAFTECSGKKRVLERGLQGGAFNLYSVSGNDWQFSDPQPLLGEHNHLRTDTISNLLLTAAGFQKAVILTGIDKGTTRQLSFRDIAHMTLVGEGRIIADGSPIFPTDQFVKKTEEMATFSHLISGVQWTGVIASPDIKIEKATWLGKSELYEQLIAGLKEEVGTDPVTLAELGKQIESCDQKIREVSSRIEESSKHVAQIMGSRKASWGVAQAARSRLVMIDQLRDRFSLLQKHYKSDLDRLRFISDGDFFLAQLGTPHCPFCGDVMTDHAASEHEEEAGMAGIQWAAAEEAKKINANEKDLKETLAALEHEYVTLLIKARVEEEAIVTAENAIKHELEPRIVGQRDELAKLVEGRLAMLSKQLVQERLAKMTVGHAELGKEPKAKRKKKTAQPVAKPSPNPASDCLRLFADEIGEILKSWNYLKSGIVEFNHEMDLVVAGEPRENRGKGIRAILHSAFTIAIMNHCEKQGLSHTGLVLLDSPLTSFKEKDGYEVQEDIQIGFFKSLLLLDNQHQVIVFENKEPPAELLGELRHTHFSGAAGIGRRGFIPDP